MLCHAGRDDKRQFSARQECVQTRRLKLKMMSEWSVHGEPYDVENRQQLDGLELNISVQYEMTETCVWKEDAKRLYD